MKTKPIPVLPLPIHTNDGDLFDSCDCRIARLSVLGEKYAEFIVRACNSHEKLLEACKKMVVLAGTMTDLEPYEIADLEQAETVIALAEKGKEK